MLAASESLGLEIDRIFGVDSPLATTLEGFAPRPGQAVMASAVADAIHSGNNLLVEAGTGTGKTLAYLVPALLAGSRVILSTGTKTLQDQLFHRDLPMVGAAIGRPATVVLLKGRANYLCLHRLAALPGTAGTAAEKRAARLLDEWSRVTRTGDIAEVDGVPEDSPVWSRVTSTQENCVGGNCEFYDRCHVVAARQAAMEADIVVVNHHLLLADLVLKEEGFGELLPGCDAIVIDEAHQFPDIAQAFFNASISAGNLIGLANDFCAEALMMRPADGRAGGLADALIRAVRELRLSLPAESADLRWEEVGEALEPHLTSLVAGLDDLISWFDGAGDLTVGAKRCRERACKAVDRIEQIASADEGEGLRWVGLSLRGFTLNHSPIDIASGLQRLLNSQAGAWIFTSATLAVGDDFSHFKQRIGLEDVKSLLVPSPFDYAGAGLLLLPSGMPEPASAGFIPAMVKALVPLLEASRGRAFLLFTSHRALREAADLLRRQEGFEYPLLVQGEAPRSKLLEQFTALPDPVLLGTTSFWEGVDMRGDRLVLVAIDRLPFASPGDPLLQARLAAITRGGGKPFVDYQLPQAVLALKQGVGRLIRDTSDRGVVVICDPRISSRGYGRQFLANLPPFPVTGDAARAAAFLDGCRKAA